MLVDQTTNPSKEVDGEMASKNTKISVKIEEDIRIFIHRQIDLFLQDEQQSEYDFPATLTNQHRAYIHEYVKNKRIKSRSHGKGMYTALNYPVGGEIADL